MKAAPLAEVRRKFGSRHALSCRLEKQFGLKQGSLGAVPNRKLLRLAEKLQESGAK